MSSRAHAREERYRPRCARDCLGNVTLRSIVIRAIILIIIIIIYIYIYMCCSPINSSNSMYSINSNNQARGRGARGGIHPRWNLHRPSEFQLGHPGSLHRGLTPVGLLIAIICNSY